VEGAVAAGKVGRESGRSGGSSSSGKGREGVGSKWREQ
jgi:hypothetical protein